MLFSSTRTLASPGPRPITFISTPPSARRFSAAAPPEADGQEQAAQTIPEPTEAEKEKGRHEWGLKYNDECLKFEKEWEIIAKSVME